MAELSGHVHVLVVRDDFVHPETGLRQVERHCVCGLSERRKYNGDEVLSVRYRWFPMGGGWADATEILMLRLPVALCDVCGASGADCEKCDGLGVVEETGEPLGPPPRARRRR